MIMGNINEPKRIVGLKMCVDRKAQEFGMFYDQKTNSYWFGEKVKK